MTKLEELPKPLPTNKARSNLTFGWLISTIVITGLVNIFIKSNQWVKMALSLVFMVLSYIVMRVVYRAYIGKKSSSKDKDNPPTNSEVK